MAQTTRKIIISIAIAIVSVVISFGISQYSLIQRWEDQTNDILFRKFLPKNSINESVIIAIDQNSLDYFQNKFKILWPWPRDVYAAAIEYLNHCGAKVITLDILFNSPDIDRLNMQAKYADSVFAHQMRNSRRVILAVQLEDSTHIGNELAVDTFLVNPEFDVPTNITKGYPRASLPIPEFQEAVALPGVVNFFTDPDGVCRSVPLVFKYNEKIIPYMALASIVLYEKNLEVNYDITEKNLTIGHHSIPIDRDGFFNIYWYGSGGPGNTFSYVSFIQLIQSYLQWKSGDEQLLPIETFRDKAVFIGGTAAGLMDLKTTPFTPIEPYPGVEIYATIFSNIIRNDFVSKSHILIWGAISFFFLFILSLVWQKLKIWQSAIISLIFFSMPLLTAIFTFQKYKLFIPTITSEIAIILSIVSVLVVNYLTEGREKILVKKVFSRYLHPSVVEILTDQPEKVEMGGKETEATVLFTDIQGFTGISEHFNPQEIVHFLNNYFEKVEQIIFQSQGMLDKYTGDGIMAIFGAPVEDKNHAVFACNAALEFKNLSNLKIETEEHTIPLITRVGINSGRIIVGNIGSSSRMDYTAIGDTVNLSSRLEGVNKIYGTQNIVSQTTHEFVKDTFLCRELDYIRVKGRGEPLRIFTVVSKRKDSDNQLEEFLSLHKEALESYRKRDYKKATKIFKQLSTKDPGDQVAKVFLTRCKQLKKNPTLIDEQGVFNILVK